MQDDFFGFNSKHVFDLGEGAELVYWRNWLAAESETLMTVLMNQLPWEQPEIRVAGRVLPIPRLQCWYGDAGAHMRYSGRTFSPLQWNSQIAALRDRVMEASGETFNSALLNLYRGGQDSVGWHADNEPEFGIKPAIASLSLGARRSFQLKAKNYQQNRFNEKPSRYDFDLGDGDLLLMRGTTQENWQHAVPKTNKRVGPRINMTFRLVYK